MTANPANGVIRYLRRVALRQDAAGLTDGELMEQYVTRRDEAAFEALVHRHGPMILGTCRRILRNEADAEDAFQATFLVFVRKAASIRSRGTVSNWLYGVAHNTALKAKAMNHKRHLKEREAGTVPKREARAEIGQEAQALLDTELSKLADKYRIPIVLCDLEGRTIKEAARHLGWPQGTMATRLTRGRAQLTKRMTKHGLTLSGVVGVAVVLQGVASANVPMALIASTTNAASLIATTGQAAAVGVVSANVAALTEGMMKTLLLTRPKFVMTLVLALASAVGGWGAYQIRVATLKGSKEFVKSPGGIPPVAAPAEEDEKPDGKNDKAIAGAVDDHEKLVDHRQDKKTSPRVWKADTDGEDDLKRKFLIDRAGAIARGEAAFRKEDAGTEDAVDGKSAN
jgi:RNA polymerase sigma factor (sigma-70 family)